MEFLDPPVLPIELTQRYPVLTEITESSHWVCNQYRALAHHSEFTGDHSARVSILAGELAVHANLAGQLNSAASEERLSKDTISTLKKAALIHDIGKIYVSTKGLMTPYEELSDIDKFHLQNHPLYSYLIVREHDDEAARMLVAHHEFQGKQSGPRSPLNTNIFVQEERRRPLSSQMQLSQFIIIVSDCIDAALSVRPYRTSDWKPSTYDELYRSMTTKIPHEYQYLIDPAIKARLAMD